MTMTPTNPEMEQAPTETGQDVHAFAFGDPEPVLDGQMVHYLGIFPSLNGNYYQPPVSLEGLAKMARANTHHESALFFKRNMVMKYFVDIRLIKRREMRYAALDWHTFGNCYFQVFRNGFGAVVRLARLPALNMRVGVKPGSFFFIKPDGTEIEFKPGEVIHLKETDITQSIYGMPQYLGGLQSVLLNENATLFRRRYYINGAHAGYIFVTYDLATDKAEAIQTAMQGSKGPGNYRSLYLNMPSGHNKANLKDRVQMIPVGEMSKDDFEAVKNVTQQDILNMHRIYPSLAAMMPMNTGGFGDIEKISKVYWENEVVPMQQVFLELNDYLPEHSRISFKEPDFLQAA